MTIIILPNSNVHIPLVYYSKKIHLFLLNPSWSWEKRDPDQWLHRGRVLPGQHVWGRAGKHGRVRFKLHQACAERKATGQSPPMLACACESRSFVGLCADSCVTRGGWGGVDFYLVASDSAARLPHEDSAQLSPPEEDGERKQHTSEELRWSSRRDCSSRNPKHLHTLTLTHSLQLALVLHFSVVP